MNMLFSVTRPGSNCLATLDSNATQTDFSQFDGQLLGQIFSVDEQCRNTFGADSVFMRVSEACSDTSLVSFEIFLVVALEVTRRVWLGRDYRTHTSIGSLSR